MQLKSSKSSYSYLKQEFDDYKAKASKTLQAKDRLIATFKENSSMSASSSDPTAVNFSLSSIEFDELRNERDSLKDELASKSAQIDMMRAEMADTEQQMSMEIEQLRDQIRTLDEQQEDYRQSKDYLDQDLKNMRQQLDYAQSELYRQKSSLNARLQEREAEIERLRNQVGLLCLNGVRLSWLKLICSHISYVHS